MNGPASGAMDGEALMKRRYVSHCGMVPMETSELGSVMCLPKVRLQYLAVLACR